MRMEEEKVNNHNQQEAPNENNSSATILEELDNSLFTNNSQGQQINSEPPAVNSMFTNNSNQQNSKEKFIVNIKKIKRKLDVALSKLIEILIAPPNFIDLSLSENQDIREVGLKASVRISELKKQSRYQKGNEIWEIQRLSQKFLGSLPNKTEIAKKYRDTLEGKISDFITLGLEFVDENKKG